MLDALHQYLRPARLAKVVGVVYVLCSKKGINESQTESIILEMALSPSERLLSFREGCQMPSGIGHLSTHILV